MLLGVEHTQCTTTSLLTKNENFILLLSTMNNYYKHAKMRGNTKIKCMLMTKGGNKNETTTCNIETGRNGAALRLGCMVS